MRKKHNTPTRIFSDYHIGQNFKMTLGKHGLFEQSKINERFFVGDQWYGANCGNDRPLVRHNVIKRIGEYKMSVIGSSPVTVNYTSDGVPNTVGLRKQEEEQRRQIANGEAQIDTFAPVDDAEVGIVTSALSDYFSVTAERVKWNILTEQALRNAYVSGTGLIYTYWDSDIKTGLYADETHTQPISGDLVCEVLDVANVVFGDPNCDDLQKQPYILIAQRLGLEEVKRMAKRNRRPAEEIEMIKPDRLYADYSPSNRGELEPENSKKVTVITKLYKEYTDDGAACQVKAIQVCSGAVIRPEWDLMVRMYPLAAFSWERRRGSIYGESEITYLVPNQIAINRMLTAATWSIMLAGMPIMAVNRDVLNYDHVTNAPGQVLEWAGMASDIQHAIMYFQPPNMTANYQSMISDMIGNTLTQSGANDAALGDVRPDNTSAIIAVREAATMPLQPFKQRFYQFCEDIARIWAEFWIMLYGRRALKIEDENGVWYLPFDGARYKDLVLSVKVDVGASTLWSEAQSIQTLDNLLAAQLIDPVQYLERLPKGIIPDLTGLINSKRRDMEQQQAMQEAAMQQAMQQQAMAQGAEQPAAPTVEEIIGQLSPEEQEAFNNLPREEQERMLQEVMMA